MTKPNTFRLICHCNAHARPHNYLRADCTERSAIEAVWEKKLCDPDCQHLQTGPECELLERGATNYDTCPGLNNFLERRATKP